LINKNVYYIIRLGKFTIFAGYWSSLCTLKHENFLLAFRFCHVCERRIKNSAVLKVPVSQW